jgi:hypothetical protein
MDMTALLLLVAFRHRIKEADIGAGITRFEAIIGRKIDEGEFQDALARAVARGDLRDPVRLLPGALQCHWHVELTPGGIDTVRILLREHGRSADDLADLIAGEHLISSRDQGSDQPRPQPQR